MIAVEYTRTTPDIRLRVDSLVAVLGKFPLLRNGEAIRVSRLRLLEIPLKIINPFETVPHHWVRDRQLVERAAAALDTLPISQETAAGITTLHGLNSTNSCWKQSRHPARGKGSRECEA
ncbi:hypothetical protein GALL_26480 [mine drainage metagenome]|uniref:Uncharacterized protein n=1 Tax=mine drainage metagenome TaxID=410659 RepID=A0A1J5TSX7_9ZZZZ